MTERVIKPAVTQPTGKLDLLRVYRSLFPIGTVMPYTSDIVPEGWVICDGRTLTDISYPSLKLIIGTRYGSGGVGAFKIPDLRGVFIRGSDNMETVKGSRGIDGGRTCGSNQSSTYLQHNHPVGGSISTTNSTHSHSRSSTATGGSHRHSASARIEEWPDPAPSCDTGSDRFYLGYGGSGYGGTNGSGSHDHSASATCGAGADHNHNDTISYTPYNGSTETRPRNIALNYIIRVI